MIATIVAPAQAGAAVLLSRNRRLEHKPTAPAPKFLGAGATE